MTAKVLPFTQAVPVGSMQKAVSGGYIGIIDDDEPLRRALSRLVAALSFQVRTYGSGREFLNSLSAGTPACLILDVQMLEMTGLEIAHHLADLGPRIPIIFLTAHDQPGVRSSCEMAGGSAFLVKPVMRDLLLESVNSAMREPCPQPLSMAKDR